MPIGEYIHYTYQNYVRFGLNKPSDGVEGISGSARALQAYQEQRQLLQHKIASRANSTILKTTLEHKLNYFNPARGIVNGEYAQEEIKQMEEMIEQVIMEKLDKYLINGTKNIDWTNLTVFEGDGLGAQGALQKKNARWELETKGENIIGSVVFRLKQLANAINEMGSQGMESAALLQSRLSQLEVLWNEIANTLHFDNSISNKGKIYWGDNAARIAGTKNFTEINGANVSFIDDLNNLWKEFKKSVASYVQGQLGEYYAALALQMAGKTGAAAEAELEEFISSNFKGKNIKMTGFDTEVRGIKISNVVTQYWTGKKDKFISDEGLMSSTGGKVTEKQGKIDLSVNLPELGIQDLGISVKNYSNQAQSIHIHSGRSILMLMQQYSDFMNHYLNITSSKNIAYIGSSGKRMVFGGAGGGRSGDITMMKQMLKLSLLVHGLIGEYTTATGVGNKAEVMIVNQGGIWKVYFMQDIINALLQNPALGEVEGLDGFEPVQHWHGGLQPDYRAAYGRITDLLAQLNNFKLNMSISVASLI